MSTQFGHPSHPAASPLGKPVAYAQHYAPELLFPIARQGKRDEIGIAADALPFVGEDLWNAYELSWLDPRGKPVVALAQFVVPAWSPNIIESKSFKLYLNSFNQTKLSDVAVLTETLVRDLSAAAGAPVSVHIEPLSARPRRHIGYPKGVLLDTLEIDVDRYTPDPGLLRAFEHGDEVGIGVADIISICGLFPFAASFALCSTPNLCCSSATTNARS